nr:MAG TPA: hypothetical protein [Caudoviricetes sp.]
MLFLPTISAYEPVKANWRTTNYWQANCQTLPPLRDKTNIIPMQG